VQVTGGAQQQQTLTDCAFIEVGSCAWCKVLEPAEMRAQANPYTGRIQMSPRFACH